MLKFTVYIEPMGKGRPRCRAFMVGGKPKASMYPDPKTAAWEQEFAALARRYIPAQKMSGPLTVTVRAVFSRPQRLMRKADPDGLVEHHQKPDWDNVAKITCDAMGEFWGDDAQIQMGTTEKWFAEKDGAPRIQVWVNEQEGSSHAKT